MHECCISWNGRKLTLALPGSEDHIARTIIQTGTFYELELLEFLVPFLYPGDLVLDVGANVGNHTIFFGAIAGCNVISYEPMSDALACLRRSVELNSLGDRVQIRPVAVGQRRGAASPVRVDPGNWGATRLTECSHGSLPLIRLDDEEFPKPVKILKIDVEGMEAEVLKGAAHLIERDAPIILCELWDRRAFSEASSTIGKQSLYSDGNF